MSSAPSGTEPLPSHPVRSAVWWRRQGKWVPARVARNNKRDKSLDIFVTDEEVAKKIGNPVVIGVKTSQLRTRV
eukprot:767624-Amorphochlora_amoeboformis.AAC.2